MTNLLLGVVIVGIVVAGGVLALLLTRSCQRLLDRLAILSDNDPSMQRRLLLWRTVLSLGLTCATLVIIVVQPRALQFDSVTVFALILVRVCWYSSRSWLMLRHFQPDRSDVDLPRAAESDPLMSALANIAMITFTAIIAISALFRTLDHRWTSLSAILTAFLCAAVFLDALHDFARKRADIPSRDASTVV